MYGNVMFLAGENKSRSCWRIVLSSSFPPGMMNEGACKNKPVGEDDSVGDKPGEEITLQGITLWEEILR